jgi:hypothetical protein
LLPLRSRPGFAAEDGFGVGTLVCDELGDASRDELASRGAGAIAQPQTTHAMQPASAARRREDGSVGTTERLVAISHAA